MTDLLFENAGVRGLFDDRGGPELLITFNELEAQHTDTSYWGDGVARALGLSCVGIVSKAKNWFPPNHVFPELDHVRRISARFDRVFTYGFSQGAYGALKYGAASGAQCALAFSPQISIEPAVVGGYDQRYLGFYQADLHDGMQCVEPDLSARSYVFYDPHFPVDGRHVDALGPTAKLIPVPMYFVGHATVRPVAGSRHLRHILDLAGGGAGPGEFFHFLKARKRANAAFYWYLGIVLEQHGRTRLAQDIFDLGYSINPAGELFFRMQAVAEAAENLFRAGQLLRDDGRESAAHQVFAVGRATFPRMVDSYGHPRFAKETLRSLLRLRDWHQADTLISELMGAAPADGWPYLLKARALGHAGHFERGAEEWGKVLRFQPDNPEARDGVEFCRQQATAA